MDPSREARASKTLGNGAYLDDLRDLEKIPIAKYVAASLFSGIGGFSLGFRRCGFDVRGFVEIDQTLSSIYRENFPNSTCLGEDITKISDTDLREFRNHAGDIDVVIGGPPCQGFSLSGKRDINDPRNYLFQEYLRVIDILSPKLAIIENVKLLTSMRARNGGLVKDAILSGLNEHGYRTKMYEVNAKDYGVPQHRERVVFVAVREDLNLEPSFPAPDFSDSCTLFNVEKRHRTFGDACSDLEYIESGQDGKDPHHKAVKHPQHVIQWLWDVPEGVSAHNNENPEMRPPSGYNTTYKRQIWDEPGATVQTTFGMISGCRNVHPIATRSLTIREACRIQSFPDTYKLGGSQGSIRTGIGNAVPPLLAMKLAKHIAALLADFVEIPSL